MRGICWLLAITLVVSETGGAQSLDAARAGVVSVRDVDSLSVNDGGVRRFGARTPRLTLDQRRTIAPLASAAIPGAGQVLLGQSRSLAYLALEAVAWWRYATDIRERTAQEERYKDVARRVARAQFSSIAPDTEWVYYEQMRDYLESGQFSLSTTGPVQPETDPTTFNGSRWVLAQSTNASRADALAQYERTAVKPDFRWSWRNARLQYDIFTRYTAKRNDADRAATRDLLVIGANHVLSMVDAFATMRLQVRAEADGRTSIGARFAW